MKWANKVRIPSDIKPGNNILLSIKHLKLKVKPEKPQLQYVGTTDNWKQCCQTRVTTSNKTHLLFNVVLLKKVSGWDNKDEGSCDSLWCCCWTSSSGLPVGLVFSTIGRWISRPVPQVWPKCWFSTFKGHKDSSSDYYRLFTVLY